MPIEDLGVGWWPPHFSNGQRRFKLNLDYPISLADRHLMRSRRLTHHQSNRQIGKQDRDLEVKVDLVKLISQHLRVRLKDQSLELEVEEEVAAGVVIRLEQAMQLFSCP